MPDHYMVSPHKNTENFFMNAWGSNVSNHLEKKPFIVPVFNNPKQRRGFLRRVNQSLAYANDTLSNNPKDKEALTDRAVLTKLQAMSHSNGVARFTLSDIRPKSHVIVQGHGMYGDKGIMSDAHQGISSRDVATYLKNLRLPKNNLVRANSCYSGAASKIKVKSTHFDKHFRKGNIGKHYGGKWDDTFAGSLETELRKQNMHNRVVGYLGETTQFQRTSKNKKGDMVKQMAVGIPNPGGSMKYFAKNQMTRSNTVTKNTIKHVAKLQGTSKANANDFRSRLLAAHGLHKQGAHKVQQMAAEHRDTVAQRATGRSIQQIENRRRLLSALPRNNN